MKKDLYAINGEEIGSLPFEINWVEDLLYYEWPLISVYSDALSSPYIKIWVDTSKDLERYILFPTSKKALEGYVLKQITFNEFFKSGVSNQYYALDIDRATDGTIKITNLNFDGLNKKYMPKPSLFNNNDPDALNTIFTFFKLDMNVDNYWYGNANIKEIAKAKQEEVINIHLSSFNGLVGHGDIDSNILGKALGSYNDMAEAAVINIYEKSRKTSLQKTRWSPGERDNVINLSRTRFYAATGSFDIYLYPIKHRDYNDGSSFIEQITNRIFDLFKMGDELNFIDTPKSDFPQEMLNAYEDFLKIIQYSGISVSLQYGNPTKENTRKEFFDSIKASKIVKKLRVLEKGTPIERKFTGSFSELSKNNHTFEFTTASGNKLKGAFDKKLQDGLYFFVNLHASYQITVETYWETRSGRSEEIERNIIVGYIKL